MRLSNRFRVIHNLTARSATFLMAVLIAACCALAEPGVKAAPAKSTGGKKQEAKTQDTREEGDISRWYLMFGFSNAYPKMESEELIRKYFDGTMHKLSPTYDDVLTVGDLRDSGILWAPYIGVGYAASPHWCLFGQVGYTSGKVRTKADDPSWLLLPLHTDFEIERGALYGGIGADFFPLGMPELREYHGITERLKAAKPSVGMRVTVTEATYKAKIKVGFKPFDNLVDYTETGKWVIPSFSPNVGVDVPLGRKSQLSLNASKNWFTDENRDFDGFAFTIIYKRFFQK